MLNASLFGHRQVSHRTPLALLDMEDRGPDLEADPPDLVPPTSPSAIRAEDTERARVATELLRMTFAGLLKRVWRSIVVVGAEVVKIGLKGAVS